MTTHDATPRPLSGWPTMIAIDGPAASGKSTVASAVARELGYLFVDTGAFYRAATLLAIRHGMTSPDRLEEERLAGLVQQADMDIRTPPIGDRSDYWLFLDQENITDAARSKDVEAFVSPVATLAQVRESMNEKQRALARRGPVIMVGRDIGTKVLPDAALKIYLDASAEVRAQRRFDQYSQTGRPANYDELLENIRARDLMDTTRAVDPLRRAEDAIYLDTSSLSIEAAKAALKVLITSGRELGYNQRL